MFLKKLITGFLMSCADSVPGVSGGTMAYMMGLFDSLIDSIKGLARKETRMESFKFLVVLGIGWIVGFVIAVSLISKLLDTHFFDLSSLFLGFILMTIFQVIKQEISILKEMKSGFILSIIAAVIVIVLAYLGTNSTQSDASLSLINYIILFISGAVAICCMLLPGISGSGVFLIFGVYSLIIESVHKFFNFDFSQIGVLIAVACGILFGLVTTVKLISDAFKNHKVQTVYVIIGLLIGSIYAIIVGPFSEMGSYLTIDNFNIIWFLIGVILLFTLDKLSKLLDVKK